MWPFLFTPSLAVQLSPALIYHTFTCGDSNTIFIIIIIISTSLCNTKKMNGDTDADIVAKNQDEACGEKNIQKCTNGGGDGGGPVGE